MNKMESSAIFGVFNVAIFVHLFIINENRI